MQETQEIQVRLLGLEDSLQKEMATYSSILAWKIPWIEGLGGHSPWGHKELDTTEHACAFPLKSTLIWPMNDPVSWRGQLC